MTPSSFSPPKPAGKISATQACAVDWTANAFAHRKVIGHTAEAQPLLDAANVKPDAGIVALNGRKAIASFIAAAKNGRIWDREPSLPGAFSAAAPSASMSIRTRPCRAAQTRAEREPRPREVRRVLRSMESCRSRARRMWS